MTAWAAFKTKLPSYVSEIEDIQIELTQGEIVGHPDIVHKMEINDIKTGNRLSLSPKYCVQASKYAIMKGKTRAAILMLSKQNSNFLYIWWDGELVEYFGRTVFDAFKTIYDYDKRVKDMVRDYMEQEALA